MADDNVWQTVLSEPRNLVKGDAKVLDMATHGQDLYVFIGDSYSKVYRLVDPGCMIWDDVTPGDMWWAQEITGGENGAMVVYNNNLHVGTSWGDVLRTDPNTKFWIYVSGNLMGRSSIYAMSVFQGNLYAAAGGIYQATSTTSAPYVWIPIPPPPNELGGPNSLANFNDLSLWAGVGYDNDNGIALWKTDDGTHWSLFHKDAPALYGHVHALAPYKNHLYVGMCEGSGVIRTDMKSSWDPAKNLFVGNRSCVYRLAEYNGALYLGQSNFEAPGVPGQPLILSTLDGVHWTTVPGSPTVSDDMDSVTAFHGYDGGLYVGVRGGSYTSGDGTGTVAILRYGPEAPCMVKDVKGSIDNIDDTIDGYTQAIELCQEIDCSSVLKRILMTRLGGPKPGETWQWMLIDQSKQAVDRMHSKTRNDATRALIKQRLDSVELEVEAAISPFIYIGPGPGIGEQATAVTASKCKTPSLKQQALAHLKEAKRLAREAFVLLSFMEGKGPAQMPPGRP